MKVGIIRYPGSNCDKDMLHFFKNSIFIWHKETRLPDIDMLIIPGGFAFGDRYYEKATGRYVIAPGKMAIQSPVTNVIREAVEKKILILGICNGFQILTQMNLLPGELLKNNSNHFECRQVQCSIRTTNGKIITQKLSIANSYGRYYIKSDDTFELEREQIFAVYDDYDNGSSYKIAGISNKERTIFGMMPHPERSRDKNFIENMYLFFYRLYFENTIKTMMQSEHISYKSTKKYLNKMHTKAPWVIQGPGENAGIIDIGEGYGIALRIESHNHPTFIDPFEGAMTGVGGILRDIFTMGARPIALLDFLRFGTDKNSDDLIEKTVAGISNYSNCIGVPNVGGDLYRSKVYNKNPILNVACIGLVKKEDIIYGNVQNEDDLLIYVGNKTGMDGVKGADMASQEFSGDLSSLKDKIQKGDPFLEKLLLEACCEIAEKGLAVGMQDLGAGGLLCASVEVVERARKKYNKRFGCEIHIDKIPVRYEMDECSTLISESQERMLIVSTQENKQKIFDIFENWDLEYSVIGTVNMGNKYEVYNKKHFLFSKSFTDSIFELPKEDWPENVFSYNLDDRYKVRDIEKWTIYDSTIGCRTIKGCHESGSYAILDIFEINKKIILTWGENIKECIEKMLSLNGIPKGVINCLNFGNPSDSMGLFSESVGYLNSVCIAYNIPILGGNVSLYNSTEGVSIPPTPILVLIGMLDERSDKKIENVIDFYKQ